MQMNPAQTFFALFYVLYFAVMTTLTGKFQPFDTPCMYKREPLAWFRFVVSFILLNIIPLAYFVWVFQRLENLDNFIKADFWSMFISMFMLLLLSLAGFGFYRIYSGVMVIKFRNGYLFYGDHLPKRLSDELKQLEDSHGDSLAHIIPGLIWVGVTLAVSYWWICLKR